MLCPEICNFPPPKTSCTIQRNVNLEKTFERIKQNSFYRSVIITLPDEANVPSYIKDSALLDSDYYRVMDCSVTELIDPVFVKTFITKGSLYCLSMHKNCITHNAVAITPDGVLTLHVLYSIYQILGLEGTKRPHSFYDITVDLHNIKNYNRLKNAFQKLENFSFHVSWVPHDENICPSTIAKYFFDKSYKVTQHSLETRQLMPEVKEIPSLDVDIDELVEWMGMVAHEADLEPKENYVSTYGIPQSSSPLQTTRICVMIVKGFISSNIIDRLCESMSRFISTRELDNYWAALSIQTVEEGLYKWDCSSPRIFQSHNSSCNIFFTESDQIIYTASQLKYS